MDGLQTGLIDMLHTFYRISDKGYNKVKPVYVNNKNCLTNFCKNFGTDGLQIICDNCSNDTITMVGEVTGLDTVFATSLGNAGSFRFALDEALKLPDDDIVYFCEGDYIHRSDSRRVLLDGIEIADVVTLYDHNDKYLQQNIRQDYILYNKKSHWRTCISTTMTWASTVGTLRKCESSIRKWVSGAHPDDHRMFCELGEQGYTLISALPAFATHGETALLAPLIDWEKVMNESL